MSQPSGADSQAPETPPPRRRDWRRRIPWRPLLAAAALGLAYWLGSLGGGAPAEPAGDATAEAGAEAGQIWTCSMHPQIRMEEPGTCPICGMDLIPATSASEDDGSGTGLVMLSERARSLARIRTTEVVRTRPKAELELLGRIEYDETRMRTVTPWIDGRIDRLHVRVTGTRIRKGQVIATLYSPEVHAAMRDLVAAVRAAERLTDGLHGSAARARQTLESTRHRLELLGVSAGQIERVIESREPPRHVEIRSPFGGTVIERLVEEGAYVTTGTPLFHVADLSRVWVQIEAYESDLPHLEVGQAALVNVEGTRDAPLTGRIAFIDPVIDEEKRTAKVRVEVKNAEGHLRPGMFAQALIEASVEKRLSQLVIPESAPLFTGRRSVVYVEVPGTERPTYELRVVRLGPRAGPLFPVLSGLSEGERVVTHGAFVLDADLQLRGGNSMMTRGDDREHPAQAPLPVSQDLHASLARVLEHYLSAQQKLSGDDLDGAREALTHMGDAVVAVEVLAPDAAREAWREIASNLTGHVRTGATSKDDGKLRASFEGISGGVVQILRHFGNPLESPLRLAHCPMAFDSRGARWVQTDGDLENPYYGSAMLRCGELRQTVLPDEPLAGSKDGPDAAKAPDAASGSERAADHADRGAHAH